MNVFLENEFLHVGIKSAGAELFSVRHKKNDLEYMWRADPAIWGKSSPVLFPIVGTLKEDKFRYKGSAYNLSRHGFARENEFEIANATSQSATFRLDSTPASLLKYPFQFRLLITYTIDVDMLKVGYQIENPGQDVMYFSLGAHPAFAVPLVGGTDYTDYYLQFNEIEKVSRWPISQSGLIEGTPVPLLDNTNQLFLRKELFLQDAIVFKDLRSTIVSLKHIQHLHGLDFHFDGFPFLGLWGAKYADFLCIEPWCGIADSVSHDQELTTKEGIQKLSPDIPWTRSWKVKFY